MWISHPDLPDAAPIQIQDDSMWHYVRSGWVETEAPRVPTTAELDAQLLAAAHPEPEAESDQPEPEPEPPPAESADETELQPAESDE